MRKALDDNGYEDVRIVASDNHSPPNYWFVAEQMQDDQEFADAVDVLGEHDVCVWRTEQRTCHVSEAALALDKPLWDSENSTQDYVVGNAVALVGGGLALAGWGGGALVAVAAAGLLVQVALLGYESVFVRAAQDVPLS